MSSTAVLDRILTALEVSVRTAAATEPLLTLLAMLIAIVAVILALSLMRYKLKLRQLEYRERVRIVELLAPRLRADEAGTLHRLLSWLSDGRR